MSEEFELISISRSICDDNHGYTVTLPNGVKCFHFRLEKALHQVTKHLGHNDREVMVIGEPEVGAAW